MPLFYIKPSIQKKLILAIAASAAIATVNRPKKMDNGVNNKNPKMGKI